MSEYSSRVFSPISFCVATAAADALRYGSPVLKRATAGRVSYK